jgi:hypothetical protein
MKPLITIQDFEGSRAQGLDESPDRLTPEIEPEFIIEDDQAPLIPEGIYTVGYLDYETGIYFKCPKIMFRFQVISNDECNGTILNFICPVKCLTEPPKRYGKFKLPGPNSKLRRVYTKLFGKLKRGDRMSLRKFRDKIILIRVKTVTKDSLGNDIGEVNWYSKIDELISLESTDIED